MTRLRQAPWWTAADAAELAVLTREFVRVALIHRPRCEQCSTGGPCCGPSREAWTAVASAFFRSSVGVRTAAGNAPRPAYLDCAAAMVCGPPRSVCIRSLDGSVAPKRPG